MAAGELDCTTVSDDDPDIRQQMKNKTTSPLAQVLKRRAHSRGLIKEPKTQTCGLHSKDVRPTLSPLRSAKSIVAHVQRT